MVVVFLNEYKADAAFDASDNTVKDDAPRTTARSSAKSLFFHHKPPLNCYIYIIHYLSGKVNGVPELQAEIFLFSPKTLSFEVLCFRHIKKPSIDGFFINDTVKHLFQAFKIFFGKRAARCHYAKFDFLSRKRRLYIFVIIECKAELLVKSHAFF